MKFKFAPILTILFAFAACNSTKQVDVNKEDSMTDVQWNLIQLNGENISQDQLSKHQVYFHLHTDQQRVNGSDGCNNFMGSYSLEKNNQINFGQLGVTKKACMDWAKMERKILAVFEDVKSYALQEKQLQLKDGAGNILATFQKSEEPDSMAITEKYWKLMTLNGNTITMSEEQEREPFFMLKTNSGQQVKGFSGCNSFSGSYTLKENAQIHFDKMASTLKACPDMDFNEGEFLKVFRTVKTYELQGDQLFFKDAHNNTLASFKVVYMD